MTSFYRTDQQLQLHTARANGANLGNVLAAAVFLFGILHPTLPAIAIMGGFAVALRGCKRQTNNLDIAAGISLRPLSAVLFYLLLHDGETR
jgi:hypothetical protein